MQRVQSDRVKKPVAARMRANNRRQYNRNYMRAWRKNPLNHARELARDQRLRLESKLRRSRRGMKPYTNLRGQPVCGFCQKSPPIQHVIRLRILENGEYKSIRVPYCGQC